MLINEKFNRNKSPKYVENNLTKDFFKAKKEEGIRKKKKKIFVYIRVNCYFKF